MPLVHYTAWKCIRRFYKSICILKVSHSFMHACKLDLCRYMVGFIYIYTSCVHVNALSLQRASACISQKHASLHTHLYISCMRSWARQIRWSLRAETNYAGLLESRAHDLAYKLPAICYPATRTHTHTHTLTRLKCMHTFPLICDTKAISLSPATSASSPP